MHGVMRNKDKVYTLSEFHILDDARRKHSALGWKRSLAVK